MLDGLGTKGSVSTMSTLGLELLNFINPDLTWKTVAKGYRSNSRRKPACRKFAMEKFHADKGARKVDDATISDTEKLGVDVLGRHFSEKVEQVPIKKRRFAAGSLSPPKQNPASRYKVIEPGYHSKRQRRATDGSIPSKFTQNLTDVAIKNKFDCNEDFSGIEILAAVACDNGMVNDIDANISLKKESTSTPLFCRKAMDYVKDVVPVEDETEVSPMHNDEVTNLQKSPSTKGDASVDASISWRVHWDLNVTMDAWEKPCIPTVDPPAESDSVADIEKEQGNFDQGEPGDIKQNLSEGLKDLPTYKSNLEGDNYEESSGLADNHDECPADYDEKPSACDVDDMKASDRLGHVDACLDDSVCRQAPEDSGDALPPLLNLMQSMEARVLDVHLGEILLEKAEAQVDTSNVASQSTPDVEVDREIDCVISKGDEHLCQQEAYVSLGVEPGNSANDVGNLCLSPAQGSTAASDAAALEGKPVVTVITGGLADEASPSNTAEVDSPVPNGSEELMQKSSVDSTATCSEAFGTCCDIPFSSTAKAVTEDPSDDNCESDVYQVDKLRAVGSEDMTGYDSQFEDGELRESDARYCWDENEDFADYGSEGEDERLCGVGNEKEKKAVEGLDRGPSKMDHCGKGDAQRDDSESPKTRTSDVTTDKNFPSVVSGSRASNRESLSCSGRHDGVRGKDAVLGGRVENGSICYRDEREASSRKFIGADRAAYIRGKSPGGRRFVNPSVGYWESDRRSSPPHRGPCSSRPSRPKSILENRGYMMASDHTDSEVLDFTGFENHSRRHLINPSTNVRYERFVKRTPTGRDDGYGMRRVVLPNRDLSPGRNRFGSYYQGIGRGKRDEFCSRSIPEDSIEYPNRHRLARRERSITPRRRGRPLYTYSYRKSRSRSRSHSPSGYVPRRERNDDPRLRSTSPAFRSNGRTERMRMPFQKRLPVEYDEGVMSPPRGHFSPQHNSRCFDERNGVLDSFRGRKSPVRMFRQSQKFDSGHSLRRFNADAQFRPMLRSRKFPDVGARGRGEYEGSGDDDQRKGRDRYVMVHRVRRYSTDGFVRRFRYNAEDSLVDSDSRNFDNASKLADRRPRDMPNRAIEEA